MSGSEEVEGMMGVERVGQGRMREVRGSFVPQLGHVHTQPWRGIAELPGVSGMCGWSSECKAGVGGGQGKGSAKLVICWV